MHACYCVGPGTGVAPMRALIQRREVLLQRERAQQSADGTVSVAGKCYLFFGCRRSDKDYYYREEWQALQQDGHLTGAFPAHVAPDRYLAAK